MVFLARLFLLMLLGLTACGHSEDSTVFATPQPTAQNAVPGEILVGQRAANLRTAGLAAPLLWGAEETGRISLKTSLSVLSAASKKKPATPFQPMDIIRLKLPANMNIDEALAQLASRSDILYAEPNYLVHRAALPNDPFFDQQWALQNIGQTLTGDKGTITGVDNVDIGATAAWNFATGSPRLVVATIDSGIDYAHPDLGENIWHNPGESGLDDQGQEKSSNNRDDDGNGYIDDVYGWNFVSKNRLPADDDVDGHGTHVAGIIGAAGNNGQGVSGVNWSVQLMTLKFLDRFGNGDLFNAVAAYHYAVDNGARLINASYTYPQSCTKTTPSLSERAAIEYAQASGVLVVVAAGNAGCNNDIYPFYPGSHPLENILSVAATDPRDNRASFSNTGAASVDLGAPGVNIYSTIRQALKGIDDQWGYNYMSGTSMAAPFVTGAAALLWSQHPEESYTEIKGALLLSVDVIPALQGRVASNGRLNIARAMALDFDQTRPTAPSDLTIDQIEDGKVYLSWRDLSNNESSFIIERCAGFEECPENNEVYTTIGQVSTDTNSYIDTTAPDAIQVTYRVKAVAGIESSAFSNSATQLIPLNPPKDLTGFIDAAQGVFLSWADTSVSETGYSVERSSNIDPTFTVIQNLAANTTSAVDTTLTAGVVYFYRVKARHATLADSSYSNQISLQITTEDKRCFIATAAWGSPLAKELVSLRRFRDQILLKSAWGQKFVAVYYRLSPSIAKVISHHPWIKTTVRWMLEPLVWLSNQVALTSPETSAETE